MVCSSFEKINRFPSLDFLGSFCVREKAFHFIFSTFSPQNVKIPVTVPLKALSDNRLRENLAARDSDFSPSTLVVEPSLGKEHLCRERLYTNL